MTHPLRTHGSPPPPGLDDDVGARLRTASRAWVQLAADRVELLELGAKIAIRRGALAGALGAAAFLLGALGLFALAGASVAALRPSVGLAAALLIVGAVGLGLAALVAVLAWRLPTRGGEEDQT